METNDSKSEGAGGFTLVEMLVVVLLIGILAAFGVPQYLRSLENSKAEDAAALANMVATTNRMYALDHSNTFVSGAQTTSCSSAACLGTGAACDLVACKYLASTDFDNKPYSIVAGNPIGGAGCGAGNVACATRRVASPNGTTITPYSGWGYSVNQSGVITPLGGAPTPTQ